MTRTVTLAVESDGRLFKLGRLLKVFKFFTCGPPSISTPFSNILEHSRTFSNTSFPSAPHFSPREGHEEGGGEEEGERLKMTQSIREFSPFREREEREREIG